MNDFFPFSDPTFLASPIAYWITGVGVVVGLAGWLLSQPGSPRRKLATAVLGGAMAIAILMLVTSLLPFSPPTPGAMP
jgi:hypothetical protein